MGKANRTPEGGMRPQVNKHNEDLASLRGQESSENFKAFTRRLK